VNAIKRWWWICRCANLIRSLCGWSRQDARDYAETLYQTYVVEDTDEWTPDDALAEDMTYWGD
jgi:hypothetical protein